MLHAIQTGPAWSGRECRLTSQDANTWTITFHVGNEWNRDPRLE